MSGLLALLLLPAFATIPQEAPKLLEARGLVTESGHPRFPDDVRELAVEIELHLDPALGEARIEFRSEQEDGSSEELYYFRRGRLFQLDELGRERATRSFADLSPCTIAALHPDLVATAMRERPGCLSRGADGRQLFAWNEELWTVDLDATGLQPLSLQRRYFHVRRGDCWERIDYDTTRSEVRVQRNDRALAKIRFSTAKPAGRLDFPIGHTRRDRLRLLDPHDLQLAELAPGLFALNLESLNSRVFVAEFADFLVVFEGAYHSRNGDRIASYLRQVFAKPVRYFAFSHIHAQYLSGTRSWVREGATILVPPSTAPLVKERSRASFALFPDALQASPREIHIEEVAESLLIEDQQQSLQVFNVVSEHTDEYLIVYAPRAKILFCGDLLLLRSGQALRGRSRRLWQTVKELQLDVDRYVATWPLDGYGTQSIVTRSMMEEAMTLPPD